MNDDVEWGPWYVHDGGSPKHFQSGSIINMVGTNLSESQKCTFLDPDFYWHWSGILWWKRRVPQPGFGCITAYRFGRRKPRSAQISTLQSIVAKPSKPIAAPEGPIRKRVKPADLPQSQT
jgi:hypothetical protein